MKTVSKAFSFSGLNVLLGSDGMSVLVDNSVEFLICNSFAGVLDSLNISSFISVFFGFFSDTNFDFSIISLNWSSTFSFALPSGFSITTSNLSSDVSIFSSFFILSPSFIFSSSCCICFNNSFFTIFLCCFASFCCFFKSSNCCFCCLITLYSCVSLVLLISSLILFNFAKYSVSVICLLSFKSLYLFFCSSKYSILWLILILSWLPFRLSLICW